MVRSISDLDTIGGPTVDYPARNPALLDGSHVESDNGATVAR